MKTKDPIHLQQLAIVVMSEFVVYAAAWLWNEYVAAYATIILPGIIFVVFLLALIADWIEPSRIPKWYYIVMIISILVPLVVGALFMYLYRGQLDWLQ